MSTHLVSLMFDGLAEVPYVQIWLPFAIALAVGLPTYFLTLRPHAGLSAAATEAAVETALDPFAAGSRTEQRAAYRRRGNPVEILYTLPGEADRERAGYVVDRSVGGMALVVPVKVAPGTTIAIRPVKASEIVPWVEVEVRSCRPSEVQAGQFDLGCQFIKSPPYSIMLLFG